MRKDEANDGCYLITIFFLIKLKIEDATLMYYAMQEIKDEICKKATLYGCHNLSYFMSTL